MRNSAGLSGGMLDECRDGIVYRWVNHPLLAEKVKLEGIVVSQIEGLALTGSEKFGYRASMEASIDLDIGGSGSSDQRLEIAARPRSKQQRGKRHWMVFVVGDDRMADQALGFVVTLHFPRQPIQL
jgi:hypothetical protein